jgi:hopene-associated glycosyltransferase HpnB
MTVLEVTALICLVAWLLLLMDRERRWPSELDLESMAEKLAAQSSVVEVVALVPARNETRCLSTTLPALLNQDGVELEVVLIDDASVDGTADAARSCAEQLGCSDRLTVVEAPPFAEGQSGKVRALQRGLELVLETRQSDDEMLPEWILLTDADILHRQGSVDDLVRLASVERTGGGLDLVSVMARLRAVSFWERLLIPPFVFFFQVLYPFRRVADRGSTVAAAAGGCILVRTSSLLRVGGLSPIADALIDDVALAKRIQGVGGNLWLGFDSGICSVRSYGSLASLWRMVSRTAFTQLRFSSLLLILTLTALAIVVVSPPVILTGSVASLLLDVTTNPRSMGRAALWASMAWAIEQWVATLPMAGVFYALMTVTSALSHWMGLGSRWKGRNLTARREETDP